MKRRRARAAVIAAAVMMFSAVITVHAEDGVYTVKRGDSLSRIAKEVYGDKNAWRTIYEANRDIMKNANTLFAGQQLTLPGMPVTEEVPVTEEETAEAGNPDNGSGVSDVGSENVVADDEINAPIADPVNSGRKPITPKEVSFHYDGSATLEEIYYRTSEDGAWILFYNGGDMRPGDVVYINSGEITIYEGYFGVKLIFDNGNEYVHSTNLVEGEEQFLGERSKVDYTGECVQFYVTDSAENVIDVDWF